MKKVVSMMFFVLFITAGQNANAQFLDRLSKKVEKKVEDKIINKTADKAEKTTGKAMDKVLEPGSGKKNNSKTKTENNRNIPSKNTSASFKSSYDFSYQYQLTMKTSHGNMVMDYFIQPKQEYLGAKMNMNGMEQFMIFENNNINTFIEMNGMKIAQSMNSFDLGNNIEVDKNDYKVSEIPGKTILGYQCKGMQMENNEYVFKIYYTNNAPFSLTNFGSSDEMIPEQFKKLMKDNTLMMEMEMTDKKQKKNNTTMVCTLVKENKFTFSTQDYTTF